MQTLPPRLVWVLVLMTLGWGINWPMLKLGLSEMQPLHFRAYCLIGGALGVIAIALLRGESFRVPRADWGRLVAVAALNMGAWNVFAAYGIPMMASGRAAIFAFSMPIWEALFGLLLLREPPTRRGLVGLALGIAGMLLLLGDEIAAVGRAPIGALLMLSAATSWALSIIVMKRWPTRLDAWPLTAWQLTIAGVPVLGAALLLESGPFFPWQLSTVPALATIYTLVVGFWLCQWAWIEIAKNAPLGVSSVATFMTPVLGVLSSAIVLGDRPLWSDYVALVLVVAAMATVMPLPRLGRRAA